MALLTTWNPFKPLTRLGPTSEYDDLFRGLGMRSMLRDFESAPEVRIEVSEDEKSYLVKAEVPGVKKEDIEISVEGSQVSIGAEIKREAEKRKDDTVIHSERYFGRIFRSFTLPLEVDSDKASAQYDNGILALTLPKKPNGHSRRIRIS